MSPEVAAPAHHAVLDAGEKRCGEMVLALKVAIEPLCPGEVLKLICRDPGAREDLPAWCRMTGHRFLGTDGQAYYIQHREV